jgi:hypothetical protein
MSTDPKSRCEPSETSSDLPKAASSVPLHPLQPVTLPSSPPHDGPVASPNLAAVTLGRTTLEQELAGEDFAFRGMHRMIDLADYLAFHVDGRSTGLYATENPETYARVLGLASTIKAAVQWFRLGQSEQRPRFVLEAQNYLADGPQDKLIAASRAFSPNDSPLSILSGSIARRKGDRGAAGRQHDITELKNDLVEILSKVEQIELADHQHAWREVGQPLPRVGWVLAGRLGQALLFQIARGWCSEMLRDRGFVWRSPDAQFQAVGSAIAGVLDDADLLRDESESRTDWRVRQDALSERIIR